MHHLELMFETEIFHSKKIYKPLINVREITDKEIRVMFSSHPHIPEYLRIAAKYESTKFLRELLVLNMSDTYYYGKNVRHGNNHIT